MTKHLIIFLIIIIQNLNVSTQLIDKYCQSGLREDNTNYIYCARQNLARIPSFFPNKTVNIVYDELVLSDNLIERIDNESFSLSFKVRKLYLDNNPLRFVHKASFDHVRNYLEELYLEQKVNKIENDYEDSNELITNEDNDSIIFEDSIFQKCLNLHVLSLKSYRFNTLKANLFSRMLKLDTLILSKNRIKQIDDAAFIGLDHSLTTLNLDSNLLEWVPSRPLETLKKLKRLSLSQNKIKILHANSFFYLMNLNSLDLSYNYLSKLDENAFSGPVQNSLRSIQLQNNELKWTHFVHLLYNLHLLQDLNLDFNKLGLLMPKSTNIKQDEENLLKFNKKKSNNSLIYLQLASLSLQGNSLTDQNLNMFIGSHDYDLFKSNETSPLRLNENNKKTFIYANLLKLNLARNKLTTIDSDFFIRTNMTNLKSLTLEKNPLENTEKLKFNGLENSLINLNLNNVGYNLNSIDSLFNLINLQTLKLNGNSKQKFNSFKQNKFNKTLNSLQSIELQNNNLKELPDFLCDFQNLTDLDLSSNSLTSLNLNCLLFKQDLSVKLKQLNLNNNPLKCDCNLRKLKIWLMRNYDKDLLDLIRWQCIEPTDLNGRYFANVELDELNCQTRKSAPIKTTSIETTKQIITTTITTTTPTTLTSTTKTVTANNKPLESISNKELTPVFELDNFSLLLVAIAFGLLFICLLILIMFYLSCIKKSKEKMNFLNKYDHDRFCSPSSTSSSSTSRTKSNDSFSRNSQLTLLSSEMLLKGNKQQPNQLQTDTDCFSYNYYEKGSPQSCFQINEEFNHLNSGKPIYTIEQNDNHIYHEINTPVKYLTPNVTNPYESPYETNFNYFVYPTHNSNRYLTNSGLIV